MPIEVGSGITIGPGIEVTSGGGGGPSGIYGSFVVGTSSGAFSFRGADYPQTEFVTSELSDQTPFGILNTIQTIYGFTIVKFYLGTFGDYTVTTSGINGNADVTVTVNGITLTTTTYDPGDSLTLGAFFSGDAFDLFAATGQTVNFQIVLGS